MTEGPRLAPLDPAEAPELEPLFARAQAKSGHIANAFLIMARRPEMLELAFEQREALYRSTTVDRGILDLVGMMVSIVGGCSYSQAHGTSRLSAHGRIGSEKADAIGDFETSPLFSDAEKAALRFARGSSTVPNSVTDGDFVELQRHFTDPEIVDLLYRACNTAWMNRWNTTMRTPLEG